MYQMAAARAALPGSDVDAVLRAYPRLLDKDLIRANVESPGPKPRPDAGPHIFAKR
jgi:hypothetical protein